MSLATVLASFSIGPDPRVSPGCLLFVVRGRWENASVDKLAVDKMSVEMANRFIVVVVVAVVSVAKVNLVFQFLLVCNMN